MSEKMEYEPSHEVHTGTLTKQELIEKIYKGESLPQDKRFLPSREGGVFKYFHLENLANSLRNQEVYYPYAEENGEIVGLAELEASPQQENLFWIKFISVDPAKQDQGFGRKVAEEVVRFAQEHGFTLEASSYSEQGYLKLLKVLHELAAEFGVELIDNKEQL